MSKEENPLYIILILSLLMPLSVLATGGDSIKGSRYVSGRGAALGDAFIGIADDVASGLFYNPAALAKVKHFSVEPINLQFQANSKLASGFGTDGYKITGLSGYKNQLLNSQRGASAALLPAFGFRGFGAGLLVQSRVLGFSDGTNIRYRSTYQLIPTVGGALNLASGVLRIGYSLQWVNQATGDKTVSVNSSPLGWNQQLAQGSGFTHNLGMSVTLPFVYQPSFHLVARDVGGLKYKDSSLYGFSQNKTGTPPDEKMSLDAAMGFVTKIGKGLNLNPQFAYRDALDVSVLPKLAHLAIGLEFSLRDRFYVRGGFGSGYPSAGIGIKTRKSELNLSWFSEELSGAFRSERDIRYMLHYVLKAF